MAVYNDHVGVASLLLNWHADVQAKRQLEITPLHLAAMRGAEEMFRLLLDRGADAKAADKARCRPLGRVFGHRHCTVRCSSREIRMEALTSSVFLCWICDRLLLTPAHLIVRSEGTCPCTPPPATDPRPSSRYFSTLERAPTPPLRCGRGGGDSLHPQT